jgi:hypothetical protein
LCEQDFDEADLIRLYGPLVSGKRAQADVCQGCQQRPVADLVAWINRREWETALRPLHGLRGVGRS